MFALDTIFLEPRPDVKLKVKQYTPLQNIWGYNECSITV